MDEQPRRCVWVINNQNFTFCNHPAEWEEWVRIGRKTNKLVRSLCDMHKRVAVEVAQQYGWTNGYYVKIEG